jgi:hypothetical protein
MVSHLYHLEARFSHSSVQEGFLLVSPTRKVNACYRLFPESIVSGAEVSIVRSVEDVVGGDDDPVAKDAVPGFARRPGQGKPRAFDEIIAFQERLDELWHIFGTCGAISIERHNDVTMRLFDSAL